MHHTDAGTLTHFVSSKPELEFYQLRAHILGRSQRMVGTALLYAPSPWINEQCKDFTLWFGVPGLCDLT